MFLLCPYYSSRRGNENRLVTSLTAYSIKIKFSVRRKRILAWQQMELSFDSVFATVETSAQKMVLKDTFR